jgi:hypothetical protein
MFLKDESLNLWINMQSDSEYEGLPDIVLDTVPRRSDSQEDVQEVVGPSRPGQEQCVAISDWFDTRPLIVSLPLITCTMSNPKTCKRSCSSDSGDSGFSEVDPAPRPCTCHRDSSSSSRVQGDISCTCSSPSPAGGTKTTRGGHSRKPAKSRHSRRKPAAEDTKQDEENFSENLAQLSQSGYYYPNMTVTEAKEKLRNTEVGTFLVRDSSQPGFIFSLSIKTSRGTTSVRVEYTGGSYRLDSDESDQTKMPKFKSMLKLIQFYMDLSKNDKNQCVWLEKSGRKDTPVVLSKPYYKEEDLLHNSVIREETSEDS